MMPAPGPTGRCFARYVVAAGLLFAADLSIAQGQDSTPGQRSLLIMSELLPGIYDNANQNYFDTRRGLPAGDRHVRLSTTISRIQAPAFGSQVFLWVNQTETAQGPQASYRLATLEPGPGADEVLMKHYFKMSGAIAESEFVSLKPADLRRTDGCDYVFKRRADHFRGQQLAKTCRFDWEGQKVYTDNEISLSKSSLWFVDHKYVIKTGKRITGVGSGEPFWLERARIFHCYADIPGVAGGRDMPFKRYDNLTIHDRGGQVWFKTQESPARELGVMLRNVTWHVLNEANNNFNRNSLVMYVMEKSPDGSTKGHPYTFTDPEASRIGINMSWMLVNCAITPRDRARPEL